MQRSKLAAFDLPHAIGRRLEFLMSKAEPERQSLGHVQWVEYAEINGGVPLAERACREIHSVAARPDGLDRDATASPIFNFGGASTTT